MAVRGHRALFRLAAGVLAAGMMALAVPAPASAQGIFERIFGGLRRAIEAPAQLPADIRAFADPNSTPATGNGPSQLPVETGPARAFCVRTCDGRFFPVQAHAGLSAAESCHSLCPAAQTRLYSGGNIDYALASDGSRYTDLDNAFVYRKQLVAGCTCNGRSQFGLAPIDAKTDPTLRVGDVLATRDGLMAVTGAKNKVADFTPIDAYRGLPQNARAKLSDVKIMPAAPNAAPVSMPVAADKARDDRRRAQLSR